MERLARYGANMAHVPTMRGRLDRRRLPGPKQFLRALKNRLPL